MPVYAGYALAYVNITGGAGGGISVFPNSMGSMPLSVPVLLPSTPTPRIYVNATVPSGGGRPCPARRRVAEEGLH